MYPHQMRSPTTQSDDDARSSGGVKPAKFLELFQQPTSLLCLLCSPLVPRSLELALAEMGRVHPKASKGRPGLIRTS